MNRILIALHLALVGTALFPAYRFRFFAACDPSYSVNRSLRDSRFRSLPYPLAWTLEEAWNPLPARPFWRCIVVATLPAILALLNLPAFLLLRGSSGDRWRAVSALILGLVSTLLISGLLLRNGYGRLWGGDVIWFNSLLLLIAGTAASARLRPGRDLAPSVVDS